MKKTIAMFLTFVLLIGCLYVPAFANADGGTDGALVFTLNRLNDETGEIGDAVTQSDTLCFGDYFALTVSTGTAVGAVRGMQLAVEFDPEVVEYQKTYNQGGFESKTNKNGTITKYSFEKGDVDFDSQFQSSYPHEGVIKFTAAATDDWDTEGATSVLLRIPFRVREDVADARDVAIAWVSQTDGNITKLSYTDSNESTLNYSIDAAQIVARCATRGPRLELSLFKLDEKSGTVGAEVPADKFVTPGRCYAVVVSTDAGRARGFQIPLAYNADVVEFLSNFTIGGFTNGVARGSLSADFSSVQAEDVGGALRTTGYADDLATEGDSLAIYAFRVKTNVSDSQTDVQLVDFDENGTRKLSIGETSFCPSVGDPLARSIRNYTLGDVNDDEAIDIDDLLLILDYTLERNDLSEGNRLAAADVNQDGVVDIDDLLKILDYTLERITNFD